MILPGFASAQAAYDAAEPDTQTCICGRRDCYDCADYSG